MNSDKDRNIAFTKVLPTRQYCFNSRLTPQDPTDTKRSTILCDLGKDAFAVPPDQDCLLSVITAEIPSTTTPFQPGDNQTFFLSTTTNKSTYNTVYTSPVNSFPDTTFILLKSYPVGMCLNSGFKVDISSPGNSLVANTMYFVASVESPISPTYYTQIDTNVMLTIPTSPINFNSASYYYQIKGASALGTPDGAYQGNTAGSTTMISYTSTNSVAPINTCVIQHIPDTSYIILRSLPNVTINTAVKCDVTNYGINRLTTYYVKTVEPVIVPSLWTQVFNTVTLSIPNSGVTFTNGNYVIHIFGASTYGINDGTYQCTNGGSLTTVVFTVPISNTRVLAPIGVSIVLCRISLTTVINGGTAVSVVPITPVSNMTLTFFPTATNPPGVTSTFCRVSASSTIGGSAMALVAGAPGAMTFTGQLSVPLTLGLANDTAYTPAAIASALNNKICTFSSGITPSLTVSINSLNQLSFQISPANWSIIIPNDIPQIGAYPSTSVDGILIFTSTTFAQVPYLNPRYFMIKSPDLQTMYSQPIAKIQNDVAIGGTVFYKNFSRFDTRVLSQFIKTFLLQVLDENGNIANLHCNDWSINLQFKFVPKQNLHIM